MLKHKHSIQYQNLIPFQFLAANVNYRKSEPISVKYLTLPNPKSECQVQNLR